MNHFYKILLIILSVCWGSRTTNAQINISPNFYYDCQDSVKMNVQLFQNLPGNLQNDDVFSGVVNLGFSFQYFGVARTQCVISSNGYISFNVGRANGGSPYRRTNLPASDDAIFFSFHDIMPSPSNIQNIRFQTYGDPGSRKFVLEFCSISLYDMPGNVYTGQLVLYEGSNNIEIHIGTKMQEAFNNNSFIGLQNGTTWMIHPTYNTSSTQWTLNNTSFRYAPSGNTYTLSNITYSPLPVLRGINTSNVKWYASNNLTTPIATGQNLSVQNNPAVSYYIVTYQGSDNTCTGTFTYNYRDTVYRQTRVPDTVKSVDTVCLHQLPHQYLNHSINSWGASKVFNVYRDRIGCDSVRQHTIFLKRIPNAVTRTICEQQLPFTWNGKTVTTTGTHTLVDTTRSAITRCDSITTLTLTVNPRVTRSMSQTICQQTLPFTWNGKTVTTSGTYTLVDTSASVVTGCDSITTLTLTVNPTLARSMSQTICQQTLPFTWNGKTVTTAGTHTLVDTTASAITGCDSITTLSLTVNATLTRNISQAICQQTLPFTWNGKTVTTVGTHTLVDTTASAITGCDSITTLTLTVNPRVTRSISQAICQQTLPFTWNGKTVNSVGSFTLVDTTASVVTGCDSITTLTLTVNPTLTRSMSQTICQQTLPFIWNGKTVNGVGSFTLVDTTASTITGCDSITTLTLTVNPTLTRSMSQTICQQTLPFTWNGKTVNAAGIHTLVDTTASVVTGCDSITTLTLTVNPTLTRSMSQAICQQQLPFTWNGKTVNAVGSFTLVDTTASTITGCDSITTLALRVNPTLTNNISSVICQQNLPFLWNGKTVNAVGSFTLVDTTASVLTGCDSITTLSLTVNQTLTRSMSQTICQQTLPFIWNGKTVNSTGNFTLVDTTASVLTGCDSITTLTLIVNPTLRRSMNQEVCQETLPFTWNGKTVNAVGLHTLVDTTPSVVTGCDSITTLSLRVYPSPVVRLGNDTAVCANITYTINGTTPNATAYLWSTAATTPSINVALPGTYHLRVTDNNNCIGRDTIVVSHLAIPVVNLGPDVDDCVYDGWSHTLNAGNTGAAFLWDNNTTNQTRTVTQNGRYIVRVTNAAGCRNSDTIDVVTRMRPIVTLIPDTNICRTDTIIIDGTTPDVVSYAWSTGVTTPMTKAFLTGKYKLVVTGTNGCTGTDSVFVTAHDYPAVDLGSDINKCADRGHLEFLNARNAGDNYLWDDNYNGQVRVIDQSGTYWVAVTNRWQCTTHDTININFKWSPVVELGDDRNVCEGVEVVLDAGNEGLYYQWNTGMTTRTVAVDKAGMYTVAVVGDNGCITVDSVEITQNGKAPFYNGIWVRNMGTHKFRFELIDAAHISGYVWDFGDGSPLSYSETPIHTFPTSGNYIVRVKVLNNCGEASDTTTVHVTPTHIDETGLLADALRVYPSPVTEGKVTVEMLQGARIREIVVVSTLGQELEHHKVSNLSNVTLDVSQYSAAAYYLRIITDKGVVNRKIVIGK